MANALLDVQQTFTALDTQYSMLRLACRTDADRQALGDRYGDAQANYEACVDKMLSDDDKEVADLSAQLKTANQKVAALAKEMGEMSKVIDDITQAVTLGSQLVTKIPL